MSSLIKNMRKRLCSKIMTNNRGNRHFITETLNTGSEASRIWSILRKLDEESLGRLNKGRKWGND